MAHLGHLRRRRPTGDTVPTAAAVSPRVVAIDRAVGGHLGVTLTSAQSGFGVEIVHAQPGDLVARAGLRAGHVIKAVNGVVVCTHEQCLKELERNMKLDGDSLALSLLLCAAFTRCPMAATDAPTMSSQSACCGG